MRAGVASGGLVFPVQLSLYANDIPTPSRHVELAQYADDTALVSTSRSPALLVGYLETSTVDLALAAWLECHQRLKEHRRALWQDRETDPKAQVSPVSRTANTATRSRTVSRGDS
jgi:hypothetical protein